MAGTKGHSGGHNRLSLAELKQRGTYRRDRHKRLVEAPVVPAGAVVKPAQLSAGGSQAWDELAPSALALGTLTPADVSCFGVLCELTATLRLLTADAGSLAALRRHSAATLKYYELFGLAGPSSRSRLPARPGPAPNPWSAIAPPSKWHGILK